MMAEKLLNGVRDIQIPHENSDVAPVVTVSIGVVTGPVDHLQAPDDYVRQADEMPYCSKKTGVTGTRFCAFDNRRVNRLDRI